jgi:hypothetical protein
MWVFIAHQCSFEVVNFSFEVGDLLCEAFDFVAVRGACLAGERCVYASLWVETDDSDSFSNPVFWDNYSGAGCAWFGYFFYYFVALHV